MGSGGFLGGGLVGGGLVGGGLVGGCLVGGGLVGGGLHRGGLHRGSLLRGDLLSLFRGCLVGGSLLRLLGGCLVGGGLLGGGLFCLVGGGVLCLVGGGGLPSSGYCDRVGDLGNGCDRLGAAGDFDHVGDFGNHLDLGGSDEAADCSELIGGEVAAQQRHVDMWDLDLSLVETHLPDRGGVSGDDRGDPGCRRVVGGSGDGGGVVGVGGEYDERCPGVSADLSDPPFECRHSGGGGELGGVSVVGSDQVGGVDDVVDDGYPFKAGKLVAKIHTEDLDGVGEGADSEFECHGFHGGDDLVWWACKVDDARLLEVDDHKRAPSMSDRNERWQRGDPGVNGVLDANVSIDIPAVLIGADDKRCGRIRMWLVEDDVDAVRPYGEPHDHRRRFRGNEAGCHVAENRVHVVERYGVGGAVQQGFHFL